MNNSEQAQSQEAPQRDRAVAEDASFRDKHNLVYYADGEIYRALSPDAAAAFRHLGTTKWYTAARARGAVVATEPADDGVVQDARARFSPRILDGIATVLRHERIPFISYPYEWSFTMLKRASELQLDLLADALAEGMILKDATPYNVQFQGSHPVFIDTTSFAIYREGQIWEGYRQFCEMCLFPLMLCAYKGVPFHQLLLGYLDGIPLPDFAGLLSLREKIRPGVFKHVVLHGMLQRSYAATTRDLRTEVKRSGFSKELIHANVQGLRKLVAGLTPRARKTEWSDYATSCISYDEVDAARKREVVESMLGRGPRSRCTWDLGCNTGTFSRIAARYSDYVIGVDGDDQAIDQFYKELSREESRTILPLVGNLARLSPGLGWRGTERRSFVERGSADMTIALAVVHHLVISAQIPLGHLLSWLSEHTTRLIIEFVDRKDPMVERLLVNREDQFFDYHQGPFEQRLGESFTILDRQTLPSQTRTLYLAESKRRGG